MSTLPLANSSQPISAGSGPSLTVSKRPLRANSGQVFLSMQLRIFCLSNKKRYEATATALYGVTPHNFECAVF